MYNRCVGPLSGQLASRPRAWSIRCWLECMAKHLCDCSDFDRTAGRNGVALDAICTSGSMVVSGFDGGFAGLWSGLSLRLHISRSRLASSTWRRAGHVSDDSVAVNIDGVVWSGCWAVGNAYVFASEGVLNAEKRRVTQRAQKLLENRSRRVRWKQPELLSMKLKNAWIVARRLLSSTRAIHRRGVRRRQNCRTQFASLRTKSNNISMRFHTTAPSLLTALDRTKHQAPVWRRS